MKEGPPNIITLLILCKSAGCCTKYINIQVITGPLSLNHNSEIQKTLKTKVLTHTNHDAHVYVYTNFKYRTNFNEILITLIAFTDPT